LTNTFGTPSFFNYLNSGALPVMNLPETIITHTFQLPVLSDPGYVTVEIYQVGKPLAVLTLGHGAGTNMSHPSMTSLAMGLALMGITTVRYNFPYSEKGRKMPDRQPVTTSTVLALMNELHRRYPHVPLFGGGKSFGGRMTSNMQAVQQLPFLKGIIFFGFPLHPAGQPATERADHLRQITQPLLFLSGTADTLAETSLLKGVCDNLPNAKLILLEGIDHSFQKSRVKTMSSLCSHTVDWLHQQLNG
jgi:predicted alpha/beta-hydrolase family hydrolase